MRTINLIEINNFTKPAGSIRTRTGFKREFIFECPMCDCKITNRTFILDSHWLDFVKKHLDEHNTVNKK